MGSELLSEAQPTQNKSKTGTEIFEEMFPYYLSIGMSPAEYWDGEPSLVRYYRKADVLKQERQNKMFWLQGYYFYDALCATMSQMFPPKGEKGRTYLEEPISFNKKGDASPQVIDEEEQAKIARAWMDEFCRQHKNKN